ncbi:MAG: DNA/RNA non-specific endonuclease [Armatimonadota bacterium]
MVNEEKCYEISVTAAKRFSTRVKGANKKAEALRESLVGSEENSDSIKVAAPEPSKGDIFRSNALAKDRTRAVIAEAGSTTNLASQLDTLRSFERVIGTPDFKDVNYLEFAIAVSRGVARVRLPNGFGTGSLVGPSLLLTNNHVIESAAVAQTASAEFDYQDDVNGNRLQVQTFKCAPDKFFYTSIELDFTIVAVEDHSQTNKPISDYPWTRLNGTPGKTSNGMPINIIQHPKGGLKQIVFRNNKVIDIPDGKPDFLYYTTDTEPGSSGSPCFTDSWDMVALHHSGVPKLDINGNVVEWIANEGVRVSAMVADLLKNIVDPMMQEKLTKMLDSTAPNPIEVARKSSEGGGNSGDSGGGGVGGPPHFPIPGSGPNGSATWTIPLTVQVSIGNPSGPGQGPQFNIVPGNPSPQTPGSDGSDLAQESLTIDPYSVARSGYDLDFLAWTKPIPLPTLSKEQKKDTVEVPKKFQNAKRKNSLVLDYHYYSVAICKSRRFAWYSAANIDGDHRPELPKRSADKWSIDPRIEADPKNPIFQYGENLYSAKNTDRGHLTRYLDLAWGTESEALSAMADTFHFTNCTLQLDTFNEGKSRWQGLERYLLENHARKELRRIIVMTGPVLKKNELLYKNDKMQNAVLVPVDFWKVCVIVRPNKTLSVTAYVMEQKDIKDLPGMEKVSFDVIPTQVTIASIEERTGLSFGMLKEHDHLAAGGKKGTLEVDRSVEITSFDDIVLD